MKPFVYNFTGTLGPRKKLIKSLPRDRFYDLVIEKGEKGEGVLLDTFDNDLLQQSLLLYQSGRDLRLLELNSGRILSQQSSEKWLFSTDLNTGPVEKKLSKINSLRAFLPVARMTLRLDRGHLLDDEGKTTARFHSVTSFKKNKVITVGVTSYLRGYTEAFDDLEEGLLAFGVKPLEKINDLYKIFGIRHQDYCAKPEFRLNPGAPAKKSATFIIAAFSKIARANEPGIIQDYDTEFLHDYRVSFRKVRSVLSLFKGVYEPEITLRLKSEFAEIMQNTNRLRDLDVYLLERDTCFQIVPEASWKGLEALFDYFARQRKQEQKKVSRYLRSKEYLKKVERLQKLFANEDTIETGAKGGANSREFACRLIVKRYEQVCSIAGTIDAQTPDEVVHRLRISCKKLRYLMEFFTHLFDGDEVKSLIKALKKMQDNLGKFNDYSVQQEFLRRVLRDDLVAFDQQKIQVSESIGALTAMLYNLQLQERKQVVKNFSRFDSFETRALFKKIFENTGESK